MSADSVKTADSAFKLFDPSAWRRAEIVLAVVVVATVAVLVVPLPPALLDLLVVLSLATSLVVMMVSLNTREPLEFSVFPTVLLMLTLYRLALNVASTRLILGEGQAGKVIAAFGNFVIGGNYAVGVVIFLILIAINFIVITKGAGRVAEVAARFTLDAMPGRQMSIDGDLSAGLIDDAEAKRRRESVSREADFYGAMDGAAKFVRGDAIAGLLITGINILGGLFIGTVQRGLPVGRALQDYTLLTVGDGLITQIPALIISTAAGIMVTRSAEGTQMGEAVARQIGDQPNAIWVSAAVLAMLGIIPGLPALPFFGLSAAAGTLAYRASKANQERAVREQVEAALPEPVEPDNPVRALIQLDRVELEVGYALIPLVDKSSGGDLLDRVAALRKRAAKETGFLIPPVRIRDNVSLPAGSYVIRIRGTELARGEIMARQLLALDTGTVTRAVNGVPTKDPSFGMPALWIPEASRAEAEAAGYTVVEASTVVATHLMEVLKRNAADLLSRQDVQEMVDTLRDAYPAIIDNVVPEKVPIGVLHRVLQRLLREQVPIRDLVTIIETLTDSAETTKDPEALTERVRHALAHVIGDMYADTNGRIEGITVGPQLEASLMRLFNPRDLASGGALLDPNTLTHLLTDLTSVWSHQVEQDRSTPLISPPGLRIGIRRLIEPVLPDVPVVSLSELPPQVTVNSIATWEIPHAA